MQRVCPCALAIARNYRSKHCYSIATLLRPTRIKARLQVIGVDPMFFTDKDQLCLRFFVVPRFAHDQARRCPAK